MPRFTFHAESASRGVLIELRPAGGRYKTDQAELVTKRTETKKRNGHISTKNENARAEDAKRISRRTILLKIVERARARSAKRVI